ncbi:hypothetical protein [Cytobacillus sp. IB215665]|uniref:hypothetical protein n=1 Tax=Cytobacillus sp. IB215665 TaxID=3097357 RepID=UPI002A153C22|nr:hypothetical protein [Cytobacillus sp. IB215665]MDX8366902.1 hypothetical protein [Cytobacillus sp. IB215665]
MEWGIIRGLGFSSYILEGLEAAIILSQRIAEKSLPDYNQIQSSEDTYEALKYLENVQQEHNVILFLDTKNQVIVFYKLHEIIS